MRFPVAGESRFLGERLAAYVANVGSFSSVNKKVLPEGVSARERLTADGARIGFDAGVGPHVYFQVVRNVKHLAALFADDSFLGLVPIEVLLESLLRDQTPLANLADVLGLLVNVFYVRF